MSSCLFVMVHQSIMALFLFCPVQLSAWIRATLSLRLRFQRSSVIYSICSLSTVSSLVGEKFDLPWDGFTVNAEDGALPWREEVDWTWLHQI